MLSCTSNSEIGGPWGRTWLLAILLAAMALGAWETHWRRRGFVPTVSDSARLFGAHWERARTLERPATVLVGDSRMLYGIDLDVFAEETGGPPPIQLGLHGRSPLPVLQELADESSFSGVVLVGVTERLLFSRNLERRKGAERRLEKSREIRANPTMRFETWAEGLVGRSLVTRNPELAPNQLLSLWSAGLSPTPRERWMRYDRSSRIDFRRASAAGFARRWLENAADDRPMSPIARRRTIRQMAAAAKKIRRRGGEVVLVRLPRSGALGRLEDEGFPRDSFWDPLVAAVGGPAIDAHGDPGFPAFATPDGSHLDARDSEAFTRTLARRLPSGPGTPAAVPDRPRSDRPLPAG